MRILFCAVLLTSLAGFWTNDSTYLNINFLIYEMKGLDRRVLKFPNNLFSLSLSVPDPLITVLNSWSQLLTSPL